ncbi:MAG: glycosyltransferase family 4 protein [bacterium]|nr:glycosyltransferase family 4 protein [bacterium]
MRVAWDLQAITGPKPTGLGVSVNMLLQATQEHAPEVKVIGLRPNELNQPLIGVFDRLKWEQWRLPQALRRLRGPRTPELLYSPALGAPLGSPVPVIAHVHDLIPLVYPRQFSGAAGWYWKELLPYTWRHCRALTVSNESVADDIVRLLRCPRQNIHVVPYYPEPEFRQLAAEIRGDKNAGVTRPKFICLGTHEPRKNFDLAIRAVSLLTSQPSFTGAELLIIGMRTEHTAQLEQLAAAVVPNGVVTFSTDYLTRREVVRELLGATALVFPSRYEGFGMPPLEAMSIGCPVILSDIDAHRKVYADAERWGLIAESEAVLPAFVGVDDKGALAGAMKRLIDDAAWREALVRSGLAYSATFKPQQTAAALFAAFKAAQS